MNWEEDELSDKEEQKTVANPYAKGKYNYNDSESSEDGKRVLKTPKEKLLALIKDNYFKIKDNLDSKNFIAILESFEEVMKNSDKIKKEFGVNEKLPENFVRLLYLVEESLNLSKEDKSKLTQKNNTAFNSLKKETKLIKPYEEAVKKYRETKPSEEDIEEVLSDLSKDHSQVSDISSVSDYQADNTEDPAVRRLKWVKKVKTEEEKTKQPKKIKPTKPSKPRDSKQFSSEADDYQPNEKLSDRELVISESEIEKELNEISNQRGHFQRPMEVVIKIEYLINSSKNLTNKIKLLNLYIQICFDTSLGQFSALSLEMWNKIYDSIITLLDLYQNHCEDNNNQNITYLLQTSLVSVLEKLELELYKALQFTDQNSSEYILRIKDELKFLIICRKIENFYIKVNDQVSISRVNMQILLHIYYKNAQSIKKMIERFNLNINRDEYLIKSCENPENFITQLCDKIYKHCDEKNKIRAMLCNVYFLCVHNRYIKAKDLFNRSYIYEIIQILKDDQLKILYNRTLAKLGLCAFWNGVYKDSLLYLNPLCETGTSKLKEYLSQSYNKDSEKSILFDKEDKKRVIPYIMTLNIDEVESTYYIVSMILNLPDIILFKLGYKHKNFNHAFKKLMDNYEKQIFNGPPESVKELILCSSTHMMKGDWKKCADLFNTVKIYNHHEDREVIKTNINRYIKETSLKCYLIFYANEFASFSLDILSSKFQLEANDVHIIINGMILEGELKAKWSDRMLNIYNRESNLKMINRLEHNLGLITDQNLMLIEGVSLKTAK